jgi:2-C-methyl-D-erythritol 4-phosphate cytidylyltransferase
VTDRIAAIIPAAGQGIRLAAAGDRGGPKAVRMLGGRMMLRRAAEVLAPLVERLVVAGPGDHLDDVRRDLADLPCHVEVVAGGATRQESVRLALTAIPDDIGLVLVHDAARPLVPRDVVTRVIDALRAGAVAVVPVVTVPDSLRAVDPAGGTTPVDRSRIRAVQTPQGFSRRVLAAAHRAAQADATDDAGLVERNGYSVELVEGDPLAFKVTRPLDLLLAEAVLRDGSAGGEGNAGLDGQT